MNENRRPRRVKPLVVVARPEVLPAQRALVDVLVDGRTRFWSEMSRVFKVDLTDFDGIHFDDLRQSYWRIPEDGVVLYATSVQELNGPQANPEFGSPPDNCINGSIKGVWVNKDVGLILMRLDLGDGPDGQAMSLFDIDRRTGAN